jgi:hypothetical protein
MGVWVNGDGAGMASTGAVGRSVAVHSECFVTERLSYLGTQSELLRWWVCNQPPLDVVQVAVVAECK